MKKYLISLFICLVMLTFVGYLGHSSLSFCINYMSMSMISFKSFSKKLFIFSMNGVCFIFHGMLFYKGSNMWRGEILITLKWKQKLEFNIFFLMHSRSFILEFDIICWLRMLWKFLLCYCCKNLLTNLFSFGGMNNVQWHQVNLELEIIIVLRI